MAEDKNRANVDRYYYVLAVRIAADFGLAIAAPAVLAAVIGKMLDERYGVYPLLTIILLIIAFILTAIYVVRKAYYYLELYKHGPEK